jgi:MoxR-like ATPase
VTENPTAASLATAGPDTDDTVTAGTDGLAPAEVARQVDAIMAAVGGAVVGHVDALRLALAAILAGGHVLIEDNPGLGKTLLARSLAGALGLGYPSGDAELDMLRRRVARAVGDPAVSAVTDPEGLARLQHAVELVRVDEDVMGYCVDLARASRAHTAVEVGVSPRGSQALLLLARAWAVTDGRGFVLPEDVKQVAVPAWGHRLVLKLQAYADTLSGDDVVRELLATVPTPPAERTGPATEAPLA